MQQVSNWHILLFICFAIPCRMERVACRRLDGYQALPPEAEEDACLADFHKRQDKFEEECEKMLMAVYDALYKAGPQPSILESNMPDVLCNHHHLSLNAGDSLNLTSNNCCLPAC